MTGYTGGLLPYRSKPQPDESLSSWIARIAVGNGLRLHTFSHLTWPGRQIWNRDVDGLSDRALVEKMASVTGTPLDRADKTVIASLEGWLFEKHCPNSTTRWVLRAGVYHRIRRYCGQQYCPRCLAEDEKPYYRLAWRQAWVTACPTHKSLLLERCPQCRSPVMFHRPAMKARPIVECGQCGFDLRKAPIRGVVDSLALTFQVANAQILERGWTQLGPYSLPYSFTYFDIMHQVARVLATGPRAAGLRAVVAKQWGGDADPPVPPSGRDRYEIERLDTLSRHRVLGATARTMADWPKRFTNACIEADLWQSWALRDQDFPPFALWEPVRNHVYRPFYVLTRGEIAEARRYLMRRGQRPGPAALKRLLGLGSEKFSTPRFRAPSPALRLARC